MRYVTAHNGFGLTERQAAFVAALVETGDRQHAVELSGYGSEEHWGSIASRNLATPAVQAALRHEINRRLLHGAAAAAKVLLDIANDATAPKGVRVDAAKAILDRAGFVAPRNGADERTTVDLASMTPDQLRTFIAQGEQELATRANAGNAPDALASTLQVVDLLD